VAIVSQSSNIAVNLTMQARGLPLAYVACLGNAAQVTLADLAGALLADDRVTALGLYAEGIGDAAALAGLAEAARAAGKGIACIKSGKTEAARSAAASHTASLAGGGAASTAFLRQIGVAEVDTPSELLETLKILHAAGPGIGRRLCSLSCSGGEAGLVADLAAPLGLDFPPPPAATAARLRDLLGPIVAVANPLDYNTFIWGDEARTADVFAAMLGAYDAGLFVIDVPREDRCDPSSYVPSLNAIAAAAARTGRPAFAVASMPEGFAEARAEALAAAGAVPLQGLETALAAIRAAQVGPGRPGWRPWVARADAPARMLDEGAAKAVLAAAGVAVPRGVAAPTLAQLAAVAGGLAPPLVLKGLGFAHKTEAGAVRLGLGTLAGQAEMPGAAGYLAEEMVTGVVAEVLLGLRRDPVYGVTLTVGMGGVAAELLADTVTLICPVTADDLALALRRLRLWPLLDGHRGRARADTGALIAAALACERLMQAAPRLREIEINPLMLCESGAVAVDAVIWEDEE
jgi:acyl-CoA synthetase (NDP forming)